MDMEITSKGDFREAEFSFVLFCPPAEDVTDLPFLDCPDIQSTLLPAERWE